MTLAATIVEDLLTCVKVVTGADATADVIQHSMGEIPLLSFQAPTKWKDAPLPLGTREKVGLLKSPANNSRSFELTRWPSVFRVDANPESAVPKERSRCEVARLNRFAIKAACYNFGGGFTQRVGVSGLQPSLVSFCVTGFTGFRGDEGGLGSCSQISLSCCLIAAQEEEGCEQRQNQRNQNSIERH